MGKNSNLHLRLELQLKERLQEHCKKNDIPASQLIRQLIRKHLFDNKNNSDN